MPDDWRDKLAAIDLDEATEPTEAQRDKMRNAVHKMIQADEEAGLYNIDPSELISALDRDELHAHQSAALDQAMTSTGRTIREPHLTHAERLQRLRGIPAVGEAGGAIKGTRPDHG